MYTVRYLEVRFLCVATPGRTWEDVSWSCYWFAVLAFRVYRKYYYYNIIRFESLYGLSSPNDKGGGWVKRPKRDFDAIFYYSFNILDLS